MRKKIILVSLAVIILTAIGIFAIYRQSSLKCSAGTKLGQSDRVPIYPNDSEETKKDKEKYNSIASESEKLQEDLLKGKISHDEFVKQGKKLREKSDATGINPKDYITPKQKYETDYNGYILDNVMIDNECRDDEGKVKPEYKNEYERNLKRKEYIRKKHKDFEAGRISVEEAEKSLQDQFNLFK